MLNKTKFSRSLAVNSVDPFGARFLTRLENVNGKLTCSLSRAGEDDCTRALGTKCASDIAHERIAPGGGGF